MDIIKLSSATLSKTRQQWSLAGPVIAINSRIIQCNQSKAAGVLHGVPDWPLRHRYTPQWLLAAQLPVWTPVIDYDLMLRAWHM